MPVLSPLLSFYNVHCSLNQRQLKSVKWTLCTPEDASVVMETFELPRGPNVSQLTKLKKQQPLQSVSVVKEHPDIWVISVQRAQHVDTHGSVLQ